MNRVNDIKVMRSMINKFINMDPKETSIKKYQAFFSRMIVHFPFCLHYLPKGLKLHRVRCHDDNISFPLLKDFWHPPIDKIRTGRLNEDGEPILYTSHGGNTSLSELNPHDDQYVSCIEFEVLEAIAIVDVGILKYNSLNQPFLKQWEYNNNKALKLTFGKDKQLLKTDNSLKDFIARSFSQPVNKGDEHLYKISIAIAKQFFLSNNIDAIGYPSVKMNLLDINIALKPQSALKKLKPVRIDVFKMGIGLNEQGARFAYPVLGCYEDIDFLKPLKYTDPRPIEGWAVPYIS